MSFADQIDEGYAAVFFMDGAEVSRQMRASEFGAFLDGYAGLSDLVETDVRAVYLVIGPDLLIQALVFFRIYFDDEGRADGFWNLPVEDLSRRGLKGPDLGAGAIRLACRSQCPSAAIAGELWDPDMTPGSNHFQAIRRAVDTNRLRLKKKAQGPGDGDIPLLRPESFQRAKPDGNAETSEQRLRRARLIREQRLRIKTQHSAHQEELASLARDYRLKIQGLKADFLAFEQKYEHQRVLVEQLKKRLEDRNKAYLKLEEKLALEADSRRQKTHTSKAEVVLLREQLERKERELELSNEKARLLEEENDELRRVELTEDSLMQHLRDQSLFLVAYHAGAGHITLPFGEITEYYRNPTAYAAAKCGVSEESYVLWLEHHTEPVCRHELADGSSCSEPMIRVNQPADYRPGRDDRCESHNAEHHQFA
jgi:hypothetical protein